MKNLYLLGGLAAAAIVVIAIGSWFINQSSSNPVSTTSTTVVSPATTKSSSATAKPKSTTAHTTTTTTTTKTTVTTVGVPKIASFSPPTATTGSTVTITGTGFDATQNAILFGTSGDRHHPDGSPDNQIAVVGSPDGKTLSFTVPNGGPSGLLCDSNNHCIGISAIRITPGSYPVIVKNRNGVSSSALFTVSAQ